MTPSIPDSASVFQKRQHAKSPCFQECVAHFVISSLGCVLPTVRFNDEPMVKAHKTNNIFADKDLALELVSRQHGGRERATRISVRRRSAYDASCEDRNAAPFATCATILSWLRPRVPLTLALSPRGQGCPGNDLL